MCGACSVKSLESGGCKIVESSFARILSEPSLSECQWGRPAFCKALTHESQTMACACGQEAKEVWEEAQKHADEARLEVKRLQRNYELLKSAAQASSEADGASSHLGSPPPRLRRLLLVVVVVVRRLG